MNIDRERHGGEVFDGDAEFLGTNALLKGGFIRRFETALAYTLEGNVEKWLLEIEHVMRETLKMISKDSFTEHDQSANL
jgi:hypothetical protein